MAYPYHIFNIYISYTKMRYVNKPYSSIGRLFIQRFSFVTRLGIISPDALAQISQNYLFPILITLMSTYISNFSVIIFFVYVQYVN
jgi:hypothetical protein